MKNSKLHTTEDKSNEKVTSSNSLTEITAEYFMATDPDRVALQRKVLAWHKAEIAKLFEQIRSEVIGEDKPDNSFDEDYINGWNNCLAEQREALTRLEKNEKVTE